MSWSVLAQGGAMGLFLLLGLWHPRVREGIFIPDTWINIVTGGVLFAIRVALIKPIESFFGVGLIDASLLGGPITQLLVAFLALDFFRYWVHYADHRIGFLWQFHAVHHSSESLNATSGLRMHLVDLVQLTFIPLILFAILFDGPSFEPWVLPAALVPGMIFDAFQHSNIAMDMSKPWNRAWNLLLNNPHFHSWHHTRDGHLRDGNYGNSLTIWDRIFRTDVTGPLPPEAFGLPEDQALENSVLGLQLLRRRKQLTDGA